MIGKIELFEQSGLGRARKGEGERCSLGVGFTFL